MVFVDIAPPNRVLRELFDACAQVVVLDGGRQERQDEIAGIARDGCWCTHVCFIHASLKASTRAKVIDVPLAYLSR